MQFVSINYVIFRTVEKFYKSFYIFIFYNQSCNFVQAIFLPACIVFVFIINENYNSF